MVHGPGGSKPIHHTTPKTDIPDSKLTPSSKDVGYQVAHTPLNKLDAVMKQDNAVGNGARKIYNMLVKGFEQECIRAMQQSAAQVKKAEARMKESFGG